MMNGYQANVVAVRMTIDAVNDLLDQDLQAMHPEKWHGVTHLFVEAFRLNALGHVEFAVGRRALGGLSAYDWWGCFARTGVKVVLTFQDLSGCRRLIDKVRGNRHWCSHLNRLIAKLPWEGSFDLELDVDLYEAVDDFDVAIHQLWLTVSNDTSLSTTFGQTVTDLMGKHLLHSVVLKSFGYYRFNRTPTSRGMYQVMEAHPDAALKHFRDRFQLLNEWVPANKIVMEMSADGLQYEVNTAGEVQRVRVITRPEIRHLLREKQMIMMDGYDSANGCCMHRIPQEGHLYAVVSYDDDRVREQKLRYVEEQGLAGVLVGEPNRDLAFPHADTLLNVVKAHACCFNNSS